MQKPEIDLSPAEISLANTFSGYKRNKPLKGGARVELPSAYKSTKDYSKTKALLAQIVKSSFIQEWAEYHNSKWAPGRDYLGPTIAGLTEGMIAYERASRQASELAPG